MCSNGPNLKFQFILLYFFLHIHFYIGHSGSGKSTIANLIERFYDADSGSIRIDGTNVKDIDLKWLRSQNIGYINQEPSLFATSRRFIMIFLPF